MYTLAEVVNPCSQQVTFVHIVLGTSLCLRHVLLLLLTWSLLLKQLVELIN
jgi:hypothetical protein